jgi:hypothetical protein
VPPHVRFPTQMVGTGSDFDALIDPWALWFKENAILYTHASRWRTGRTTSLVARPPKPRGCFPFTTCVNSAHIFYESENECYACTPDTGKSRGSNYTSCRAPSSQCAAPLPASRTQKPAAPPMARRVAAMSWTARSSVAILRSGHRPVLGGHSAEWPECCACTGTVANSSAVHRGE